MKILEKAYIGKVEIKNRIVMAPMNVGALNNSDGTFSERAIEYFTERARGGVGLIITGSVRVTREFERSKETIPLWMPFADHKIHIGSITELVSVVMITVLKLRFNCHREVAGKQEVMLRFMG